ncbi:Hypothetical predicted protein, partial [Olea europaea subsp. europaea]
MEAMRSFVVSLLRVALATACSNSDAGDDEKLGIRIAAKCCLKQQHLIDLTHLVIDLSEVKRLKEDLFGKFWVMMSRNSAQRALDDETGLPSSKASPAGVLSEMN